MKSFLILLHLVLFFAFQSAHAENGFVRFTIDKNVYESLDESQKNTLSQKIQELDAFIEKDIKGKIPTSVMDNLFNLKIKITFTDKPGRDGLFTPNDSGEHTISVQFIQMNSNGIKALLAHEIYHAIHYQLNPDELPWIREGMAQLFEYITTGELNGMNLYAAIKNPMTPLLGNYDAAESNPAQYGHNMLYFYYLYNHCGEDNIFWKITEAKNQNGLKGSFLIDAILKEINSPMIECRDFADSATIFEVAKLHNQIQFLNLTEKNKFYLAPMDIMPKLPQPQTSTELDSIIKNMPVLSSYKLSMDSFIQLKGKCPNCELYYALKTFPYTVSEAAPKKSKDIDVILVKLRKN